LPAIGREPVVNQPLQHSIETEPAVFAAGSRQIVSELDSYGLRPESKAVSMFVFVPFPSP
jgi:hypothetical protein